MNYYDIDFSSKQNGQKEIDLLWEEHWKPIVTNDDGSINIEQLKKELWSASFIADQCSKVYCEVTGGILSKPNYYADGVIGCYEDKQEELIDKEMAKDDLLMIIDTGDLSTEEIKKEIVEYFK